MREGSVAVHDTSANFELDWPSAPSDQKHTERVTLMRPIPYEICMPINQEAPAPQRRIGLSLNISSGGMLLLMNHAPELDQVVKVFVPTPINMAKTPTLAEVRWKRCLPLVPHDVVYCVGLKFLF
jgi:hypothetical protein